MAERRIDIILRWLEEHPEVVEASKKRLEGLYKGYVEASVASKGLTRSAKEQVVAHGAVKEQLAAELEKVAVQEPSYRMLAAAHKKLEAASLGTGRRLAELAGKFRSAGYQVGFFGWIVTFSIRSMMRVGQQLFSWFTKIIGVSVEWPTSLAKVARALGLLQSRGLLSAEMSDLLYGTIDRLIEQGPDFQALWAGFESLFIAFATIVTTDLIPILSDLLNWLAVKLADPATREWISNTARMIVGELIPALVGLIPGLITVINAFIPLLPIAAELLRLFGPLVPIMFLLGTVFWALGPIFTAISGIILIVSSVAGFLAGTFGICSTAAGGLGIAIGTTTIALGPFIVIVLAIIAAIAAVILIWKNWDKIVRFFTPVIEALRPVGESLVRIFFALGNIIYQLGRIVFELIRIAITPLLEALRPVYDFLARLLKPVFDAICTAVKVVTTAVKAFVEALKVLAGFLEGVGGFLKGIADGLAKMCFRHAAAGANVFKSSLEDTVPLMEESISAAERLRSELEEPFAGAVAFRPGVAGARGSPEIAAREVVQYITVSAPITIESVSAEVDLDEVQDRVQKGIAKGVEEAVE